MIELKAIIIDEMHLVEKQILRLLRKLPHVHLIAGVSRLSAAVDLLQRQPVDVLFLCIAALPLPSLSRFKDLDPPPMLVLITDDAAVAFEGYVLNALDLIRKDELTEERLRRTLEKAHTELLHRWRLSQEVGVYLKDGPRILILKASMLYYVQAYGDYMKLFTLEGERMVHNTLKNIIAQLPSQDFAQVHRSYLINIHCIKAIAASKITLQYVAKEIPIGQKFKASFFKKLGL